LEGLKELVLVLDFLSFFSEFGIKDAERYFLSFKHGNVYIIPVGISVWRTSLQNWKKSTLYQETPDPCESDISLDCLHQISDAV
jgi:hypothetical protein